MSRSFFIYANFAENGRGMEQSFIPINRLRFRWERKRNERRICSETPPSGDAVREGTCSVSLSPAAIPQYENNDPNDQDQHIVVPVYFNEKTKID